MLNKFRYTEMHYDQSYKANAWPTDVILRLNTAPFNCLQNGIQFLTRTNIGGENITLVS